MRKDGRNVFFYKHIIITFFKDVISHFYFIDDFKSFSSKMKFLCWLKLEDDSIIEIENLNC